MKFKILKGSDSVALEEAINRLLLQGWKLKGELRAVYTGNSTMLTYVQAMTLEV